MKKILIFTPRTSQRLDYILRIIFVERLGLEFEITHEAKAFEASELPKICYAAEPICNAPFIAPARLLFETGIQAHDLSFVESAKGPVLFAGLHKASAWPFDLFAASFHLLSRYEEYLPFKPDQHGRFDLDQSMLQQQSIYRKPIVDQWIMDFAAWLKKEFPALEIVRQKYTFQPTYDIDIPYAYRMKGMFRIAGGYLRDLLKFDIATLIERNAVLFGKAKDPFDTFGQLFEIHKEFDLDPVFFILFAPYGEYDKNPATHNPGFSALIKDLRDRARIGIHPSYRSAMYNESLKDEVKALSTVINEPVRRSRQHYLKLQIPDTYRNLAAVGIEEDFTMGFAATGGFRAGTSISYTFYDLEYELPMPLKVTPFSIMDGTLLDYMNLDPQGALDYCSQLIEEVRKVKGTFTTLWHNESLSEKGRWKGWNAMYRKLVSNAV